ncbi:hypothetical protein [Nocardia farcinica]|uniref:hypothetical protein n=1 Tax=Nocardia farcinica TaxID=37329 RepID=UPI0015F0AA22|nr:hypothetical protein [Nocardia farcinica]MBA4858011.1 hypothetical protein [Nocardia farcinica]MBC9819458.1 hypothetical protein [Nocardia farcinica]
MSALDDIDTDSLVMRAAVLAAAEKSVGEQAKTYRAELNRRLSRGSKLTAFDPRDTTRTLGTVSMTNPRPQAQVVDREAFERWCRLNYPDQVETWPEFGDPAEVAAVLAEHAPHLLTVHRSVPVEIQERALDRAAVEDVPGTTRYMPRPTLQVRPTGHARAVVAELLAAIPALAELESAGE